MTVFAREMTDDLASLVKKIDKQIAEHEDKQLKSFVVLLTDDPDATEEKLTETAKKHGISENVPLTLFDGTAGPPKYKIAEDADVTVLLWTKQEVKANHAFKKGEFNAKAVDKVMADLPKILE
ncbi:MAG: hypothetical protein KY476_21950 [Planctomycetes bacterium]|nr:hypothetical protein [Planctomycetota bacterium]